MKTIKVNDTPIELSWKNIVTNRQHNINNISEMAETAILLGYPLILWNGRIYIIIENDSKNFSISDSNYTEKDIE